MTATMNTTMRLNCAAALAAALLGAPLFCGAAPAAKDAKPAAKDAKPVVAAVKRKPPTEAEAAKARKEKRPFYTKAADALEAAWNCQQPLVVFFLLDDPRSQISQAYERKLLNDRRFRDDYAKSNLVLLKMKFRPDARERQKISLPRRDADLAVVEKFGRNPKNRTMGAKFDHIANYPSVVILAPSGAKSLFRMPKYDKNGGFGAWMSTLDAQLRMAKVKPVVSETVQKIIDNPTEPKKWT